MRKRLGFFLVIAVAWMPLFMGAWDKDKPAPSTSLRNSNPEILANWSALETAIGQDHEFSTGGTNSGNHEVLTMEEEASPGASSTDELHVHAIDGGTQPELAVTSEDGTELQMTKDGDLYSSNNLVVDGTSTLTGAIGAGTITLAAGKDLIGSSTSDITINTNKFTVDGATGNTVVAGTASVGGTFLSTGIATLADASTLATSAAPTADAEIAPKKYVDDQLAFSAFTTNDSESNVMLKAHAYLAVTDGFVNAIVSLSANSDQLQGFVGSTDDPAGAGSQIGVQEASKNSQSAGISFPVAAGEFFEITVPTNNPTIWWKSRGPLSNPIDQD